MPKGFFHGSKVATKEPAPREPQCGACKLYKSCKSPKMEPTGKGKKRILVIAEAPGKEEDKKGIQLVGNSGRELEKTLRNLGVSMRKDCVLTNAVICRPPDNATPNRDQIEYCRPNLDDTIKKYNPEIIIPIGAVSMRSLIEHVWKKDPGSIGRWAGFNIPSQRLNSWICPTYHPAFVLREKKSDVPGILFNRHLAAAVKHKGRPFKKVPNYGAEVRKIRSPKEAAKEIKRFHKDGGDVAFDYETNRLKPDENSIIVSCSLCLRGKDTIAYTWQGPAIKATGALLLDKRVPKIAANIKFEDRWTRVAFGKKVANWKWCTQTMAHVLDNRRGITSVKFQAFVRLGQDAYDEHIKEFLQSKRGKSINRILEEIDLDDLLLYNGMDSLLEYHIMKHQENELKERLNERRT